MTPLPPSREELCFAFCAIAGPIERHLLPSIFEASAQILVAQGLLILTREAWQNATWQSLHQLQKQLCPQLKPLLADLEQKRSALSTNFGSHALRARMRQALVLEQPQLFSQLFKLYGDDSCLGWNPDRYHCHLWHELVGSAGEGSELIPPAHAPELRRQLMLRAALGGLPHSLPAQSFSPEQGADEEALLAAMRADAATLAQAPASSLVHALRCMLAGQWKDAHAHFSALYSYTGASPYSIAAYGRPEGLALALLNALRAKAGLSIVRRWLEHARWCLIESLDGAASSEELARMRERLHSIELTHELWHNSREPEAQLEALKTLLRQLIEGARAYPLLSYYLDCAEGQARSLEGIAPLITPHFAAQKKSSPPLHQDPEQRIYWDLHLNELGELTEIQARLLPLEGNERKPGRALSLEKLREGYYQAICTPEDALILPHIRPCDKGYEIAASALLALAQHPRLRLLRPQSAREPLRLRIAPSQAEEQAGTLFPALSLLPDGSYEVQLPTETARESIPPQPLIPTEIEQQGPSLHLNYRLEKLQINLGKETTREQIADCLAELEAQSYVSPQGGDSWLVNGLSQALTCLELLHKWQSRQCLTLLWYASSPLKVFASPKGGVRLSHCKIGRHWLSIGAELAIDEARLYALEELMELYPKAQGNYIPLGGGEFLSLSNELKQQLTCLKLGLQYKQGKAQLAPSMLPRLAQCWQKAQSMPQALASAIERTQYKLAHTPPTPPALQAQLRPYQERGFHWLAQRAACAWGACLADDMGLGKTLQILTLLLHRCEHGASLIIAPLSLLRNWKQEAARFTPTLKLHLLTPRLKQLPPLGAGDVLVISYGQLIAQEQLFKQEWNGLICDEAQALKNPHSLRSKAVLKLKAQFRVAATGTPVENNLLELWSLMRQLNPDLLPRKKLFQEASENPAQREALLQLIAPFILRRCKTEVLAELPPLIELEIRVQLGENERALYESCRRQTLSSIKEQGQGSVQVLAQLTRLRRICCHAGLVEPSIKETTKLEALRDLAHSLKQSGHRALIFSQFTSVLQSARTMLDKEFEQPCLYLDGQTAEAKSHELIEQFQHEGAEADFFLISLKAGGSGLNLTGADYVILLDPWWNPAVEDQAASRAHRMGQKSSVTVCRLIAQDTVEERVMQLHREKRQLAHAFDAMGEYDLAQLLQ